MQSVSNYLCDTIKRLTLTKKNRLWAILRSLEKLPYKK